MQPGVPLDEVKAPTNEFFERGADKAQSAMCRRG